MSGAPLRGWPGSAFGSGQIGIGLLRQVQAEPLASQRLAILQPGIADIALRHTSGTGQATRRLLGVETALLHPQPQVLAMAGQRNVQYLVDLEVLGGGLEYGLATSLAMGNASSSSSSVMPSPGMPQHEPRCPPRAR